MTAYYAEGGGWQAEHDMAATQRARRDRKGCGGTQRIGRGAWSPLGQDAAGVWRLWGVAYDSRELAQAAFDAHEDAR